MVIANIKEYGPAKNRPHDSEIVDGEGYAVMQRLSARGCEKEHIPLYCQEAQMTRGDVESKKCCPGGFYNGAQTRMRHT